MAEKELKKLNRRNLLQMLLTQCEETERLQKELDELTRQHELMTESYERLKIKLNVKDERLNEKDAKIAELNRTMEEMRASREIELEEAGSIAEAALRMNGVFEAAQRAAEQYLMNVRKMSESHNHFKQGKISSIRKKPDISRGRQLRTVEPPVMAAASGDNHG